MFEKLQKKLLNRALGRKDKTDKDESAEAKKRKKSDEKTKARLALEDALSKLEDSGEKMDGFLENREAMLAQAKETAKKKMTPERKALIENALRIRKQKEKILDDLDDETKAKLYITAIRAFMQGK